MYRLRAEAAQNRRDDGHGRGYAWGQGKKRLRPRKVIKEHKRNSGVRTDSRGTVESAPRAGLQTSAKAVSPLRFGHRAHKVGYGKVGKAMRQDNRILRGNG